MKKSYILATIALCALPSMAQSQNVSLIYTQLTSRDFMFEGDTLSTEKSKGFAIRYGHDITTFRQFGGARLAFEGTWMPRTSGEDLQMNGQPLASGVKLQYRHEYLGLGLSMAWTRVVDFGAALEIRHEGNSLRIEGSGIAVESGSDVTRPWLSLRGGYTFPQVAPGTRIFVGLEYNLPLAKKEVELSPAMGPFAEFLIAQNLNPKSQLSLNVGIRF